MELLQAEKAAQTVLPQVAQGGIDRDLVKPGEEGAMALKAIDGLKGLDEGVLGQVGGIFPVGGEVVDDPENPLPVFQDQAVKSGDITRLHLFHDGEIRIGLLLALRGANDSLGENLG